MNYWIFQAMTDRYDLSEKLIPGDTVTWLATKYRARMSTGDVVYLWLGGSNEIRGIYGMGKLVSQPFPKPEWDSFGVDVKYEKRLISHIPANMIRAEPELKNLLILRAPQATNFLLSPEEGKALIALFQQYPCSSEVYHGT